MSLVSMPAMKPAGSSTAIGGTRRRLASTWEPTARTKISPTPSMTWLVVTAAPAAAVSSVFRPVRRAGLRELVVDVGHEADLGRGEGPLAA